MNIQNLAAVPILLGFATFFMVTRDSMGESLYRYYDSRPEPKWRPHWLSWAFRQPIGRRMLCRGLARRCF